MDIVVAVVAILIAAALRRAQGPVALVAVITMMTIVNANITDMSMTTAIMITNMNMSTATRLLAHLPANLAILPNILNRHQKLTA